MSRSRRLVVLLAWMAWSPLLGAAGAPTLDECDAAVRDAPEDPGSYYCFVLSVNAHGAADDAVRRLEAILAIRPDRHRARLALAFVEERRGGSRAARLYREVADAAAAVEDHAGEVYARLSLGYGLGRRGRFDEADREFERALEAAQRAGDRSLLARVRQNQGLQALARQDYGRARRLFGLAEQLAFPDGDPQVQGFVLSGLGNVCWYLGEFGAAMATFRREADHWRRLGDAWHEAAALYNVSLLSIRLEERGRITPAARRATEREALAAAVRAGNVSTEAAIRLAMAEELEGRAAIAAYERVLALSRGAGATAESLFAQRLLAKETFALGPPHREAARRLLDEAIEEAQSMGRRFDVARGLVLRAEFAWDSGPRDGAVAAYQEAFDAVEGIRDRQQEDRIRGRVFSQWLYPYYRLAGRLLAEGDLELAFRTIERMRARVLLDSLDAAGVATPHAPRLPELREVQRALGADQALLGFQLPSDRHVKDDSEEIEGGAWVVAVTRDAARAFRVPRRHQLEEQVEVFLGLFGRRDGSDAVASTHIYRDLLGDALAWLPETVTRLVIVPDESLHRLPFAALREDPRGPPLAARLEIAYVPSAQLWLRWKDEASAPRGGTLAIVDPEFPGAQEASEERRQLGPLPHARREADALLAIAGRGTLRAGPAASENYLKQADLGPFGIVHLGTHAVVDEARPDRSAVVLTPGASGEDGLLRIHEIVDLDLDGKLVILAACRSARGEVLQGEGVLGLARAFFQAGARGVVGSLWPLRDDEAAALMEEFARGLARGESVAAAMAQARRARMDAGAVAEAWAGWVVLGDGDLVPLHGRSALVQWWPVPEVALTALFVALLLWLKRRR